ncbi:hypothetical protein KXW88_004071, partial [Aspergillus fumigatus]
MPEAPSEQRLSNRRPSLQTVTAASLTDSHSNAPVSAPAEIIECGYHDPPSWPGPKLPAVADQHDLN